MLSSILAPDNRRRRTPTIYCLERGFRVFLHSQLVLIAKFDQISRPLAKITMSPLGNTPEFSVHQTCLFSLPAFYKNDLKNDQNSLQNTAFFKFKIDFKCILHKIYIVQILKYLHCLAVHCSNGMLDFLDHPSWAPVANFCRKTARSAVFRQKLATGAHDG